MDLEFLCFYTHLLAHCQIIILTRHYSQYHEWTTTRTEESCFISLQVLREYLPPYKLHIGSRAPVFSYQKRELDHSLPFLSKFKNKWSCTFITIHHYGVYRDNFTFELCYNLWCLKNCAILSYYAANGGNFYRRFDTTYGAPYSRVKK